MGSGKTQVPSFFSKAITSAPSAVFLLMLRYICIESEPHWLVINKGYILSVKQG